MKKRGPINFAQRFYDAFGFAHDAIYPQWKTDKDYKHYWVLLEDLPSYAEKYASVFDNYNIYTTLNHYPVEYADAREKYREAKLHHERFLNLKPSPSALLIKDREQELAAIEAAIPKECFVDFGFDFDAGEKKPIRDLKEAAFFTLKLLRFFERKGVPYQMFYTGGRGFHVVVDFRCFEQPLDVNNHLVNKAMAKMIEEEAGGLFIDDSIYSSRRQFRLPNSIHNTSGMHKVFLTIDEMERGIDHVKALAAVPRPIPPVDHAPSEYLCRLYGLAKIEVDKKPKYTVKVSDVRELQAARQSSPDAARPVLSIVNLHHPPCIREALEAGIKDGAKANRNMITVFLATYFKAIGRGRDETAVLLTDHAVRVLARFSGSGVKEIESSTKGAVATVFRYDKYRFNCGTAKKFCFSCNDTCELFKKYRESVYNRRLLKTDLKPVMSANLYSSPEEIREAILNRIHMYLRNYEYQYAGKALLVRAPAGSGKTTIAFDYLSNNRFRRVCWVASQHALYENIPENLRGDWKKIEGRHPDIENKDGTINPANCTQWELAQKLREKRLNVNRHLCSRCDDRDACEYLAQFRDGDSHWFIQQQTFLYKAEKFIGNFDVVVFDEDILSNFIDEIIVTAHDVSVLDGYIGKLIDDLKLVGNDDTAGYEKLQLLLQALEIMLLTDYPRKEITGDILHRRLDEICREAHGTPLREILPGIGAKQRDVVDDIYFNLKDDELPLDFVRDFIDILRFEIFEKAPDSNLSRMGLTRRRRKVVKGKEGPFETIFRLFFKIPMPPCNKPIIVLDATGRETNYRKLLERDIELFDAAFKFRNRVTQLFSSASTITSLNNDYHKEKMFELLEFHLAREPCSLVIAKKSLGPAIKKKLPPQAAFTHFYGNRGMNAFMGFKQIIVFGAPAFSSEVVLMYASCLFYDQNLRTDTGLVKRTYTGTDHAVNIFCFLDPLIQGILEVSREDECYQSLNRGRLILDSSINLVLLTNIVIEQLPVTELVSIRDVIGRKEDAGKESRRTVIRELIESQLDSIGFICAPRTIRPFVESGQRTPREIFRYFSDRQAVIHVPPDRKMTRRAVEGHIKDVIGELGLATFRLFYQTPRCHSYFDIHGHDESCLRRAADFFSGCPGFDGAVFRPGANEGAADKKPHQ